MDLSTRYKLLLRTEGEVDEAESKVNANKDTINNQQQRIAVYNEQHELSFEANAAAESTRLEKNLVHTQTAVVPQLYESRFNRSCFPLGEVIPIGYQAVVTRGYIRECGTCRYAIGLHGMVDVCGDLGDETGDAVRARG